MSKLKFITGSVREIKEVHKGCYNNSLSTSFGDIYHDTGAKIKTDIMVTLLDNTRRRVYAQCSHTSYILYVFIGGEKCALEINDHQKASVVTIFDMTTASIKAKNKQG